MKNNFIACHPRETIITDFPMWKKLVTCILYVEYTLCCKKLHAMKIFLQTSRYCFYVQKVTADNLRIVRASKSEHTVCNIRREFAQEVPDFLKSGFYSSLRPNAGHIRIIRPSIFSFVRFIT